MTNLFHSATITAYETKDDLFSAVCKNNETGEIVRVKGFATKEEATYAAQMMAFEIAPCTFAPIKKGNDYYANAWVAV